MGAQINLYRDDEGLYKAVVTLPSGEQIEVDPRNVFQHTVAGGPEDEYKPLVGESPITQ